MVSLLRGLPNLSLHQRLLNRTASPKLPMMKRIAIGHLAKSKKELLAATDPWEEVDTGGCGKCGYTCLAAVLAMETGQSFDKVKNDLRTRAKTVSHD